MAQTVGNNVKLINEGVFSVDEGTLLSMLGDFNNTNTGIVKQDGTVYFYGDFNNDNLYYHSKNTKESTAVFKGDEIESHHTIKGSQPSEFYNLVFKNETPTKAFDLQNELNVSGLADFQSGVVVVDSLRGMLTFQEGSAVKNVSNNSHVQGKIEKLGNESFVFPSGDQGLYRFAEISDTKGSKAAFVVEYKLGDDKFFKSRPTTSGVIKKLNTKEYWLVDKSTNSTANTVLKLSWNENSTPIELLQNPEQDLHIVRYDAKQQLWVDEGGIVDVSAKTITTPTVVNGYGFFTLATVNTNMLLDGDVVIYNFVSPNDDGKNSYFIIDNINKYPNNRVEIFNRWGVKVYETTDYNNPQKNNVFRGYSDGRVTVEKGKQLPSGTYFYVVSYEYKDRESNGSSMVKKSGYLQLESN